jgi:hypothetical protein
MEMGSKLKRISMEWNLWLNRKLGRGMHSACNGGLSIQVWPFEAACAWWRGSISGLWEKKFQSVWLLVPIDVTDSTAD